MDSRSLRNGRMRWRASLIGAALVSCNLVGAQAERPDPTVLQSEIAAVNRRIAVEYPRLEALYKEIHSHPELSLQEEQTAARLARELREIGCEVTEKVGGHGVVGLLKNGAGPTVMVRTELD